MVRTSVRVEFTVSMRGWAIRYGTRKFHLPIPQHPPYLHLHPAPSCLPYQVLGNGDRQIGSLASPGETSRQDDEHVFGKFTFTIGKSAIAYLQKRVHLRLRLVRPTHVQSHHAPRHH